MKKWIHASEDKGISLEVKYIPYDHLSEYAAPYIETVTGDDLSDALLKLDDILYGFYLKDNVNSSNPKAIIDYLRKWNGDEADKIFELTNLSTGESYI